MYIIGNYSLALTDKWRSHAVFDDGPKTLCGLVVANLRGDWQECDDGKDFDCLRCKKAFQKRPTSLAVDGAIALFPQAQSGGKVTVQPVSWLLPRHY